MTDVVKKDKATRAQTGREIGEAVLRRFVDVDVRMAKGDIAQVQRFSCGRKIALNDLRVGF